MPKAAADREKSAGDKHAVRLPASVLERPAATTGEVAPKAAADREKSAGDKHAVRLPASVLERPAATTGEVAPKAAADREKSAGEKPAVRLPASGLDVPAALMKPHLANGGGRGEARRGERVTAVRLRQRHNRTVASSTSMPALPAKPVHTALRRGGKPSTLQGLPFLVDHCCKEEAGPTGTPSPQELGPIGTPSPQELWPIGTPSPHELVRMDKLDRSCSTLFRRRRDHLDSRGKGDALEWPAGSRPEGDDVEPKPRKVSRQVSRKGSVARSTNGTLDTPVTVVRPEQACSAQGVPTRDPSRPAPPDVAVEIHRYAKEMAVPLDGMRTAFSLFRDHAVVPRDGSLLTDGYLTRSNIVPLFRQMLGEAADAEEEGLFLDRALKSADKDGNGVLNFHEFAIWYSSHCFVEGFHLDAKEQALRKLARKLGVSATEIDVYKRHFDTFDADSSGSIDAEEFEEVLYMCGNVPRHIGLPTSRINQLWMAADTDGSGEIDFEEFVVFFRKYFQKRDGDRSGFERYYSQGLSSLVRAG
jgi:Ca2+-binding EF-hand superfamily protein